MIKIIFSSFDYSYNSLCAKILMNKISYGIDSKIQIIKIITKHKYFSS